jgi:hypothetical protein
MEKMDTNLGLGDPTIKPCHPKIFIVIVCKLEIWQMETTHYIVGSSLNSTLLMPKQKLNIAD